MNYRDKLKDPRWQRKRLEVLQRDSFTCCHCGDDKTELHIHHLKYSGDPWEAKMEDMITVCVHCHNMEELLKKHAPGSKVIKVMRRKNIDPSVVSMAAFVNYNIPDLEEKNKPAVIFCDFRNYIYTYEFVISLKALKEVVEMCELHKKD